MKDTENAIPADTREKVERQSVTGHQAPEDEHHSSQDGWQMLIRPRVAQEPICTISLGNINQLEQWYNVYYHFINFLICFIKNSSLIIVNI